MKLLNTAWPKVAAVIATGGTAAALFMGPVVHTQFSATKDGTGTVNGAQVALDVNANNSGTANFSCSGLVPGATPAAPWAGGGYCTEDIVLTNSGSTTEVFSIAYGQPGPGTSASLTATDLGYLNVSYNVGSSSAPSPYYPISDAYSLGSLSTGQQLSVQITLTLSDRAGNDWAGAKLVLPYTVTATMGSGGNTVASMDGTYTPPANDYSSAIAIPDTITPASLGANGSATFSVTVASTNNGVVDNGPLVIAGFRPASGTTGRVLQGAGSLIYAQDNSGGSGFCFSDHFSQTSPAFGDYDTCYSHSGTGGSTETFTVTVDSNGKYTDTVTIDTSNVTAPWASSGTPSAVISGSSATYTGFVDANSSYYPALYMLASTGGSYTVSASSFGES